MNLENSRALATSIIKRLEACRLSAYKDSVGKWTCGWGSTGIDVGPTTTWTQEIADHRLNQDMAVAEDRLTTAIFGHADTLEDHQFAALWSFVFNVGEQPNWQIWKDINSGDLSDVPAQLLRFDHGKINGKLVELPGLKNRRMAEIVCWNTADVNAAVAAAGPMPADQLPSATVREIETPPVPKAAPPLNISSIATKAVTAVAGVTAAVGSQAGQIHDVVAAHASEAPIFNTLTIAASGVVVAAAIIGILIHAEQAHARTA